MFGANNFTYVDLDGRPKNLKQAFHMQIASIDKSVVEKTDYVAPIISTTKPVLGKKFIYLDSQYDECPSVEFSIIRETSSFELAEDDHPYIDEDEQRNIIRWLDNRNGFQELVFYNDDDPVSAGCVYRCIFNIISSIYHAGYCVGFNLKATFDSPYCYKRAADTIVDSDGTTEVERTIDNNSDMEEYIYPTVRFETSGDIAGDPSGDYSTGDYSISIINQTDDPARVFKFVNVIPNPDINNPTFSTTVDNELKIITGNGVGANALENFGGTHKLGMKWLRLRRGRNTLKIRINGKVTISFFEYIKMGF